MISIFLYLRRNYLFPPTMPSSGLLFINVLADTRSLVLFWKSSPVVALLFRPASRSSGSRARSAQRQQDAEGSTPTHGVRFTVSRRRFSVTATLMGVFAFRFPSTTLGYFRKPRNEANECEQQEVSCCCACLQHLCGCGTSVVSM